MRNFKAETVNIVKILLDTNVKKSFLFDLPSTQKVGLASEYFVCLYCIRPFDTFNIQ